MRGNPATGIFFTARKHQPTMPTRVLLSGVAMAGLLAALAAACDKKASPTQPGPPALLRVDITGARSVPPGDTAQLGAVARYSDGASVDVTTASSWTSSKTTVITVAPLGGLVRGLTTGESTVRAQFQTLASTREIVVVPAGTFRLTGIVTETNSAAAPVENARVEVITGSTVGVSTTSDSTGHYRLYGAPPDGDLRVTSPGYVTRTEHVQLSDNGTLNLQLAVVGTLPDFSGAYTLTIAAETCTGQRPLDESLRHRTYGAAVTQNGSQLLVKLNTGNQFGGKIDPITSNVRFVLSEYSYYYYPDLAERLPDGTTLVIFGSGTVTQSPAGLSGIFPGELIQYNANYPREYKSLGSCNLPSSLRFTLSR
jgi:hypothetical protein